MSGTGYKPRADSLVTRVIGWLKLNVSVQCMSLDDISEHCDAVRGNIHTLLRPAMEAGLLSRTRDDDGDYFYGRGPQFYASKQPSMAEFAKPVPTASRPFGNMEPVAPIDLAEVPIDDNVPMTYGRGPKQSYEVLLRRLVRPGQSAALPARLRSPVTKAIADWHKQQSAGRFCVRKESTANIRVFRVE